MSSLPQWARFAQQPWPKPASGRASYRTTRRWDPSSPRSRSISPPISKTSSRLLRSPDRGWLDAFIGGPTRIGAARAFQPADSSHAQIVIAQDLARQPDSGEPSLFEPLLFGRRHRRRLAVDEFNTACGASRVSTTRVQNVDLRVLLDCEHEAFVIGNVKRSIIFDCQFRHDTFYILRFQTLRFQWPVR